MVNSMDKGQAVQWFWSRFDLNAYDQYTVPEDAQMPYITYSFAMDKMDNIVLLNGSLWYRSTSWREITQKAEEIGRYLNMYNIIPLDEGYLYLYRGTPFAQRMSDEDRDVRRIYFNINAEYLTN